MRSCDRTSEVKKKCSDECVMDQVVHTMYLLIKKLRVLFSSTQNAAVLHVAPSHVTLTRVSVAVKQESPGRAVTAAW